MTIQRELLHPTERINTTADLFGDHFPFQLEPTIFSLASRLSKEYQGGYWHFYTLSNGGFYMTPDDEISFTVVSDNGYRGTMSADAFGITVCLYAYSLLSFSDHKDVAEMYSRHFHLLRDYMLDHPEARAILRAID